MLSRVANALYSVGRSLERAEHVARLIDVNAYLTLDRPIYAKERHWRTVIDLVDSRQHFAEAGGEYDLTTVGDFLAADEENPSSVVACITAAREQARGVRESVSSEVWEQVNRLYWRVQAEADAWQRDSHGFFQWVKMGCHLMDGLADETMMHDEGWHFLQLGKYFERTVNTARLVDLNRTELSRSEGDDPQAWAAVLKSCSAYEAYRRGRSMPIDPGSVVQFLLFNPAFPRSALFCSARIAESLTTIGGRSRRSHTVDRAAGRLRSFLEFSEPDAALDPIDPTFFNELHRSLAYLEAEIGGAYFFGGRPAIPPGFAAAPQQ